MTARQERADVEERTEALRTNPVLSGLRKGLIAKGISPGDSLLAGFMESEDDKEWGVIVTLTGQVFEYLRVTTSGEKPSFIRWTEHDVPPPENLVRSFPGVPYAIEMVASPPVGGRNSKSGEIGTARKRKTTKRSSKKKTSKKRP